MNRLALVLASAALAASVIGCGPAAGGSAIPTGALRLPPSVGPVALYATSVPAGAREIGVVEAHAYGEEGTVEILAPVLAQKAAQLGGNAVLIDSVRAEFAIVDRPQVETFAYPCGWRTCVSTRVYPALEEVMIVTMRGRALYVAPTQDAPKPGR